MGDGTRLGVIGGTFNPIHFGHLRSAEETAGRFGLDRIVFVPSAIPPHKEAPSVSARHRLAMVEKAVAGRPGFYASDVELRRVGPSYTVDTLRELRAGAEGEVDLFFLCGLDAFLEVKTWKERDRLFELAHFVIFSRPGADRDQLDRVIADHVDPEYRWDPERSAFVQAGRKRIYWHRVTPLAISSTMIRTLIGKGKSVRYLLPEAVRGYILDKGLYCKRRGNEP